MLSIPFYIDSAAWRSQERPPKNDLGIVSLSHIGNAKSSSAKKSPIFMGKSSNVPKGCVSKPFANWSGKDVGCNSPKWSLRKIEESIKLRVSPRSHRALSIFTFSMTHAIEKLPESISLRGKPLGNSKLSFSLKIMGSLSSFFSLL